MPDLPAQGKGWADRNHRIGSIAFELVPEGFLKQLTAECRLKYVKEVNIAV